MATRLVLYYMGTRRWLLVGGVLILAVTGTLGFISYERLSRQEALDAAAVTQVAGRRIEAKLMHFSDLARAYPAIGQTLGPDETPIGENELVWVIAINGSLLSGSCSPPLPGARCGPNWTLLVVRDHRTDLPPPKKGQAGTRASIVRVSDTDEWPSFFGALPDLESAPILLATTLAVSNNRSLSWSRVSAT
jgi:hypothetical protein